MSGKKNRQVIRRVLILLILSSFTSLAAGEEYQWGSGISGKLHLGESISYQGYSAEAVGFSRPVESGKYSESPAEDVLPFVILNISRNGTIINTTLFQSGDSFVVPGGELKITVKNLPSKNSTEWLYESYDPWAQVEMNPRGNPLIDVSIDSNKNEYISLSSTEIITTIISSNKGTADLLNVDVSIETDLQVKSGNLKYHYDRIKRGETITKTVVFSSPILSEIRTYGITAKMIGIDAKDTPYSAKFLKTISISQEPLKIPTLRKSSNPKIYLKDTAMVALSLKNNDKYPLKNISVMDSVPENFKLVSNTSLQWKVSLGPYEEWSAHYLIKAYFRLRNEYYMVQSESPEIFVNGPLIVLNKQTDVSEIKTGESVTVTVSAKNDGNTPTNVHVWDELPMEATLVSGNTTREEYLLANKELKFSYVIRIDSDIPVTLPPAAAQYYELGTRGGKISAVSQAVGINIQSKIVTPEPTPEIIVTGDPTISLTPEITPDIPPEPAPLPAKIEKEPSPRINPDEINNFLNLLLGCNENIDENQFTRVNTACNFFKIE
ncbi:MAG: hypothetical protein O8C58_01190 [Candidatus Methanoperedens sp.]|nr:hypothetical protein [Candidatus Methanoperedens sp.]